jgi:hypothetical protein
MGRMKFYGQVADVHGEHVHVRFYVGSDHSKTVDLAKNSFQFPPKPGDLVSCIVNPDKTVVASKLPAHITSSDVEVIFSADPALFALWATWL